MLITFVNCQKENLTNKDLEQDLKTQKSITKTVSASDIPEVMNFIATKSSDYKFLLDDSATDEGMNFGLEDNLVMTELITDEIIQATNAYAKSNYTFKLIKQSDVAGKYFLNLVVKEYKDTFYLYIVKYVPDENWLSTHSITKDFGDFTGHMYYYSDQGIYVANVTMQNGSSTSSSYNPCPDDTDDGIDIPDDDGTGGSAGELECTITTVWFECTGDDSSTPHPPEDCGAQDGPQTGSGWIVTWDCEFNYSANNLNEVLRNPCDGSGGASGGDTSSCQPDPDCVFPMQLNENCNCTMPDAIENDNVVVVTSKEEFIADLIEDSIISTNLDPCPDSILSQLKTLQQNDIANIIYRFGVPNSIYDLEIESNIPSVSGNVAETDRKSATSTYDYVTKIDPTYQNQATKIALARTILHEILHAYMISHIDDVSAGNTVDVRNFLQLWQFIRTSATSSGSTEIAQHEYMAMRFIPHLKNALKEWDNSTQADQYYEDLAWGALFNTGTFNHFHPIGSVSRTRIINTNLAEDTNSTQGNISPKGGSC